jgi:hypothetical protein
MQLIKWFLKPFTKKDKQSRCIKKFCFYCEESQDSPIWKIIFQKLFEDMMDCHHCNKKLKKGSPSHNITPLKDHLM